MRIFKHEKLNRIDVVDERFYQVGDKYYPSVTTVLESYPKGPYFNEYLKSTGFNADIILKRAAEKGTNVHNAIENLLLGKPLTWMDDSGEKFTLEEWKMINKYMEFHEDYVAKGEQVAVETLLFSHRLKLGGTADLVCKINGETWLIDFKTSNNIYKTYEMQLAVYKEMWDEKNLPKIDRYGVLWLNAATRTKKNFQGKGWQLKEFTKSHDHNFKLYQHTRALWDEEHPNYAPRNLSFPNVLQISG